MPSPARLLVLATLACLGLSACTNTPPEVPGVTSSGIGGVQASWKTLDSRVALPAEPKVVVMDGAPSVGTMPALVAGSLGEPGQPSAAVVWKAGEVGPEHGQVLDVGGDDSSADALTTVGDTTYVLGESWRAGILKPFLQTSSDREHWSAVDLPSEVAGRGIKLSQVAGDPKHGLVALGLDANENPLAISIETDEVFSLPTPDYGHISGFSAAAASGRGLVAFADVEMDEGGTQTVVFLSKDRGASWEPVGRLPGIGATVTGVVVVENGFLATGYSLEGTEASTAAWFSADGSTWQSEALPALRDHHAGWSTWLTAPTVMRGTVYVAAVDSEKLFNLVLRRSVKGRWSVFAEVPAWRTPGAETMVVADDRQLVGLRAWNGLLQTGTLTERGDWRTDGESGAEPTVSWWETVSLLGDAPLLVGGRQKVDVLDRGGWTRYTQLEPLGLDDGALKSTGWHPREAKGTTAVDAATDNDGNVFAAGQEIRPSDDPAVTDESDVVGWFQKARSSDWERVRGLAGPRAEFLNSVDVHQGEWVVLGTDRESFTGSDHSYGALWTSRDGALWKRAEGPFDVDNGNDSWLNASCRLPSGELLVVGGAEDRTTGSRGLAFRRVKGEWQPLDISGMGADVTNLDSCAGTGHVVLLQGTSGGRDGVWSTKDGKKFTTVEVGGKTDTIGTIKPLAHGFVAPGGIYTGLQQRAVVWLSKDGLQWDPIDVPADRALGATDVTPWDDGVVVALSGSTGPAAALLENAAELIR